MTERPALDDVTRAYLREEIARRRAQQGKTCQFPAKAAPPPPPEPPPPAPERERWHGTSGGYSNHRCRCVDCRAAWAAAQRRYQNRKLAKQIAMDIDGQLDPPAMFIAAAMVVGHENFDAIVSVSGVSEDECRTFDRRMRDNGIWTSDGKWGFESLDDQGMPTDAAGVEIAMHMLVADGKLIRVEEVEHLERWPVGSHLAYSKGCRCSECRAAQSVYMREWRAAHPTRGMVGAAS